MTPRPDHDRLYGIDNTMWVMLSFLLAGLLLALPVVAGLLIWWWLS